MSREELAENIRYMRKFKKEVTKSKESVIKALQDAGIMNEDVTIT